MATDSSAFNHGTFLSSARRQEDAVHTHEESVDLRELIGALWRRKWFVLFWTLAAAALFFAMTITKPVRYTAQATVMLDPRQQQVVSAREEVVSDLQLNTAILESEVASLRSSALLERVVEQIGVARFAGIDPANAEPGPVARIIGGAKQAVRGLVAPATPAAQGDAAPLISEERRRLSRIVTALQSGMFINRVGDSYVIQIALQTGDPELSALVVNGLAETYIAEQLLDRQRVAENATQWLSQQVERRRGEVVAAEAAAETYKREQLDTAGASVEVVQQQLAELNQQLAMARSERANQEARLQQIDTLIAERGPTIAAETQSSDYLVSLRQRRDEMLREDARLSATLGENHPDRRDIASDIGRIEAAIAAEVANIAQSYRNEIEVLQGREASLGRDVEALEQRLSDMSTSSLQLRQLEREAEAARTGFEDLLTRLGEIRAQAEIQRAEAKLLNPALIPTGPSAPRPVLMTAFGGTLGLTFSLIAALLMELMSAGFRRAVELERATGLKVLSMLPADRIRQPRHVLAHLDKGSYSFLGERVRQLRTVIATRIAATAGPRSVMLLSSVPDEGKTTTALALAQSYARSGVSTVLIDLDTRRPVLHDEVGAVSQASLSDHLMGEASLEAAIARSDSLRFDISGVGEHDTLLSDGIEASRIGELIEALKQRYDMVIVDAPPVLAMSDSLSIALAVDHVVYLVRWKRTPRRVVAQGLVMLKNIGVAPLGTVLTMVDTAQDLDGYSSSYAYH